MDWLIPTRPDFQVVLSSSSFEADTRPAGEPWLTIAPVLAVASIAYLSLKYLLLAMVKGKGDVASIKYSSDLFDSTYVEADDTEFQRDGLAILSFRVARILSVLVLLSLQVVTFVDEPSSVLQGIRLGYYVSIPGAYVSILNH